MEEPGSWAMSRSLFGYTRPLVVRRLRRAVLVVVAATAPLASSAVARADGSETNPQIAQSLFDDARTLMEAGRYAEACPKFADSLRLEPAGGTLLNLALCHELEGKTATAWTEFREALSIALRDQRVDRQELAELHIAALAPKLTRLTVVVPESVAARDPEITFDRSRLPSSAWNTAIPVDPGEHRIAMAAQGARRWEALVVATEAGRVYSVEVAWAEPPVLVPTHRRSTAFWLLLGGAGVSIATSAVTGVLALNANAYVKDNCSTERSFCRVDDAKEHASRARTLAWVSTAALLVGASTAVVALVLPLEQTSPVAATAGLRLENGAALATLELTPLHW